MHVVDALDVLLVREALAPRLPVVGEERKHRVLAEAEALELLEHRRDEHLRLALDRPPVPLARRLERGGRVGLDAADDLLLRREPVLALGVEDVVGHVGRPVVEEEQERLLAVVAQPRDRAVERLARPQHVRLGHLLEEVVRVEDERAHLVAVGREGAKERLGRGIERGVPVQVSVVVRVEPGHHRGHRRRGPGRGADRLVEANTARGELVDRPRVEETGAVAAEMVRAQRVRHVDDDVHERGPVY